MQTNIDNDDEGFMRAAFELAGQAEEAGEVPVGAVVVKNGFIVGRGYNRPISTMDPTAHAEVMALRDAAQRVGNYRLGDCTLYVTLEPCAMCAGAISFARLRRLYFGTVDDKGGAVVSGSRFFSSPTCHHAPEIYAGMRETESAMLLKGFFRDRRTVPARD